MADASHLPRDEDATLCGVFRLGRVGPKEVELHHMYEISLKEYEGAERAINAIANATDGLGGFLWQAHADLLASAEAIRQEVLRGPIPPPNGRALGALATYRVVALSVAVRMLEENVIATVIRNHGVSSSELQTARVAFSEVYDSSLAYRVIYYLRNAVVHGSRDVTRIKGTARVIEPLSDPTKVEATVEISLDRAAFCSKQKIKAAVRREVAALEEDPDLLAMAAEVRGKLGELDAKLAMLLFPDLGASIELLAPHFLRAWQAGAPVPSFHRYRTSNPRQWDQPGITEAVRVVMVRALGGSSDIS